MSRAGESECPRPGEPRGALPAGRRRARSMEAPPEMRLVLVGKTGAGKSSSGNTILGRNAFRAAVSKDSVTRGCCKQEDRVCGKRLVVVDTPGFLDTSLPKDTVQREVSKCINMSAPGPHAILLVIKVGPFGAEDREAVRQVEETFGSDAWRSTVVLFSHAGQSEACLEEQLAEAPPPLQEVLRKVDHRYHLLNNARADHRAQVIDLLKKVDTMVAANDGKFYSNPTYVDSERRLRQRVEELHRFYQERMEEQMQELRRSQLDVQRLQCELEEVRRYYGTLEGAARHLAEHMTPQDDPQDIIHKFHTMLTLN